MSTLLITIIIVAFVGLLIVNIYFRVQVFKKYKILVQNNVEFDNKYLFNTRLLKEDILPKYPEHRDDILGMVKNMKRSFNLNSLLIVLIIVAGLILKSIS